MSPSCPAKWPRLYYSLAQPDSRLSTIAAARSSTEPLYMYCPQVRRRAVVPAFHKQYYEAMSGMFARCTSQTVEKLDKAIREGGGKGQVNMEDEFLSLGLDIIGACSLRLRLIVGLAGCHRWCVQCASSADTGFG